MDEIPLPQALEDLPQVKDARKYAARSDTLADLEYAESQIDVRQLGYLGRLERKERGKDKTGILVIGKAPAASEIEYQLPFVGPAGNVLREAFEAAGSPLDNHALAYASNWRPRKANTPNATQLAISKPLLEREIELRHPLHLVLLGAQVCESLFGQHPPMGEGGVYHVKWRGLPATIIPNNGYVLRHPGMMPTYVDAISAIFEASWIKPRRMSRDAA